MWQPHAKRFSLRKAAAASPRHSSHNLTPLIALNRRSSLEIAGALILITLLLMMAGSVASSPSTSGVHNAGQTKPTSLNLQVNKSTTVSSDPSASAAQTSAGASVSTNVSRSSSSGASTQVTVNGQSVAVPQNGSSSQDIGNAHVDITNSQTSTGSSTNTNVTSTFSNIDSSADTSITSTGGN